MMSNWSPTIKPEFKPCAREDLAVPVSCKTTVVLLIVKSGENLVGERGQQ